MSADLLKSDLDRLMTELYQKPSPAFIMIAPMQYRIMEAATKFQGRDRRRIKREMNKAAKKQRKLDLSKPRGVAQSPHLSWRNWASTATPINANT